MAPALTQIDLHNPEILSHCTGGRRHLPNARGNIYYHTSEGTPFSADFIAEIGSEAQGTWMASYQKKTPPPYKLVPQDGSRASCPTGAPAGLCSMFQAGAAVYDTLLVSDEKEEVKNDESFELTEAYSSLRNLRMAFLGSILNRFPWK
ncbi:hypothetical protein B0H13DRAFT_1895149 [Mycena leptocephala]|nr:hypothetical protein B0H13DRAFT_1895149 [Mycena leptocephala]